MTEGMSRRDMIKASAIAGATAWTAPVIIDSLASPAAAGTVPCDVVLSCSWTYVLLRVGSTYYVAPFVQSDTACGNAASNPHGDFCCSCPSGESFTVKDFSGVPSSSDFSRTASGGCGGSQLTTLNFIDDGTAPSCTEFLSVSGGTISAISPAQIVAAIGWGGPGQDHTCMCPQGDVSVCNPEGC